MKPQPSAILERLSAAGPELTRLYEDADRVRHEAVGDTVYFRAIIEFSNHCRLHCAYCGIRGGNRKVVRYRMTADEIVEAAGRAARCHSTTLVLQSGEDPWYTVDRLVDIIRRVKDAHGLAVTLSIGERSPETYQRLAEAGCDRFLLRFETADPDRFRALHPDDDFERRLDCIRAIRDAGIQCGSGFLIGLPGATIRDIAHDIAFASALRLHMIGCGPFIAHPETPLADASPPEDKEVCFKTIAVLRLCNPYAHIPATTAFDALVSGGRDLLLQRGANVFMPNITPARYRRNYLLYPGKPSVDEDPVRLTNALAERLTARGRPIGTDPGHAIRDSTPSLLKGVVSGGQTGVDRAALDVATELGIPTGGWCPHGRLAEDGPIPDSYSLQQTPSEQYKQRTDWNVRDSDATLVITRGSPTGGTALTVDCARRRQRPLHVVDLDLPASDSLASARRWLRAVRPKALNVAGPRASTVPGIAADAREFLRQLLRAE